jgi:hypothetical protein
MIAAIRSANASSLDRLHLQFLGLLPKIESHARIYFRHVACLDRRADRVAETVALAWTWLVRLHERGKDVARFPTVFISLAARAVKCGRRATGMEKAQDAMSFVAQRRHGFAVERFLPSCNERRDGHSRFEGERPSDAVEERLRENTVTPVVDQVQFRIDFPAWMATLTPRERKIIRVMAINERTEDLSAKFTVSPGRISQMRRDFHTGWRRYCGDNPG